MRVNGKDQRTIWQEGETVMIIDQTYLPHKFVTTPIKTLEDARCAIADMKVRGAPCIGATAIYGMAVSARNDPTDVAIKTAYETLNAARPTAVNLKWGLDQCMIAVDGKPENLRADILFALAAKNCDDDVAMCSSIGDFGKTLLVDIAKHKNGEPVNILTHCNAGWVATVDWGTAISPIYKAFNAGMNVHV